MQISKDAQIQKVRDIKRSSEVLSGSLYRLHQRGYNPSGLLDQMIRIEAKTICLCDDYLGENG